MSNPPSGMKKFLVFMLPPSIGVFIYFLSKLDIDLDLVMSQITFVLFASVTVYFLFPKTHKRKRGTATPKHEQYNDSRLTDALMGRILNAYNVKEKTDETGEEIEDESNIIGFKRKSGKKTIEVVKEKFVEEEIGEEIEEEVEHKQYNDSRLTDYMMEKIMKAYNVKEETNDTDDDEEEFEEENEEQTDEDTPIFYGNAEIIESKPQFAIYNINDEEENTGLKALFSPTQLPLTLSGLWFIITIIIYNFFPDIRQSIPKSISPANFTILPILFLVGLSGLLGILFKQPSESLETTPREKIAYILNIFKVLMGWGGIYILIINL